MTCQKSIDDYQVEFLIFKDIGLSFMPFFSLSDIFVLSHKNSFRAVAQALVNQRKGKYTVAST